MENQKTFCTEGLKKFKALLKNQLKKLKVLKTPFAESFVIRAYWSGLLSFFIISPLYNEIYKIDAWGLNSEMFAIGSPVTPATFLVFSPGLIFALFTMASLNKEYKMSFLNKMNWLWFSTLSYALSYVLYFGLFASLPNIFLVIGGLLFIVAFSVTMLFLGLRPIIKKKNQFLSSRSMVFTVICGYLVVSLGGTFILMVYPPLVVALLVSELKQKEVLKNAAPEK